MRILLLLILFGPLMNYAQVSINSTGNSPHASAMLEVSSNSKGLLIPRMTTGERNLIAGPAMGLMIYNTSTGSFNHWNGSAWISLTAGNIKELSDADGDTKVEVERTADNDLIIFKAGGTDIAHFNSKSLQLFSPDNSLYIGEDAGNVVDGTAFSNTIIGRFSGGSLTSGDQNVSIGTFSSENLVSGSDNTTVGFSAGLSNNASGNTFLGFKAGEFNVTGFGNTFVGREAGKSSTASNNTFIGDGAGKLNTTGFTNTFVGSGSGASNTTGAANNFIGTGSGSNNTTGSRNQILGSAAGENLATGSDNILIGDQAGYQSDAASQNVLIGTNAGENTTSTGNVMIGHLAGQANTTTNGNTFVGVRAGTVNTAVSGNTFVGFESGRFNTTGTLNTFLGRFAGFNNTTATRNTFLGAGAGDMVTTASNNTYIGADAGGSNTSGTDNTFVGKNAGDVNSTATGNTFLGSDAGGGNTTGAGNTFVGRNAGLSNTIAAQNTFIGHGAGNTNSSGSNNTFIGHSAGFDNTTGVENIFLGFGAGANVTNGGQNVMIGVSSGFANITGTGNVLIGNGAGFNETGSNKLYIDNSNTNTPLLKGDFAADSLEVNGRLAVNGRLNVNDDANAFRKGDIRWNETFQDFEGFNGTEWLSFTEGNDESWTGTGEGYGSVSDFSHATPSDGEANDRFGSSVAISGNYCVAGSPGDLQSESDYSSAYVFVKNAGQWAEQAILRQTDSVAQSRFGAVVAIDGDYVVIGAPNDDIGGDSDEGSAYVFFRNGTTWTQQAKLTASDGLSSDHFGSSVSISGEYIVVGAPHNDVSGNEAQGSAYVFKRTGTSWSQQAQLLASDGAAVDQFGYSVSISGDYVLAGAPFDDVETEDDGSAYVFIRNGTSWSQQQKFFPLDNLVNDKFGEAVHLDGNTAAIGCPHCDVFFNGDEGEVYLFTRNGTSWTQQVKIDAHDIPEDIFFGTAVCVSGDYVMIGASLFDVALDCSTVNLHQGKAYIYQRKNNIWGLYARIIDPIGRDSDALGVSVSIDGSDFVAGSIGSDPNGSPNQGKVVFGKVD